MATTHAGDGTEIKYDVTGTGDGPAVVLVHGITESSKSWGPIPEKLAADHQVVTLDLRGHGESGTAERYDLEAMVGDIAAVMQAEGLSEPHLVGHSLGGMVVSAAGAALPVASVVNVDQSLKLADFKANLMPLEANLRDTDAFPAVIEALFTDLSGTMLPEAESSRLTALRRPDQGVVLGIWELIFTMSADELAAVVDQALSGYVGGSTPYLSLFGVDPGDDYAPWLGGFIANSEVERWADYGHYPHLIDPDRFVDRVNAFWAG